MHEGSVVAHESSIAAYACLTCDKSCQLQGPDQHVLELKFGLQVQVIIGASDGDHLSLPATVMRVNSRAHTLVVQLPPIAKLDIGPIIWCAASIGSVASNVSCTLMCG
jgi:hypothetical protein